jgi:hypothetical protein
MEPKGVRLACPECQWDCVMKHEGDLPEGVTKVVEGLPYCPNCSVPMAPIASVDTTPRPRVGITQAMTLEEAALKVGEINAEVKELADDYEQKKKASSDAKKAYEGKVITLRVAAERLSRIAHGEQIEAGMPLLNLAEQAAPTKLNAGSIEVLHEQFRQRLALLNIVVDIADIKTWTVEQYDAAVRYVSRLEDGGAIEDADRPDFLPLDPPDHVTALHRSLAQVGVVLGLPVICGWTPEQRAQAAEWAAKESESPDSSERPDFLPPAAAEPTRHIARRGRRTALRDVSKSTAAEAVGEPEPEPEPATVP